MAAGVILLTLLAWIYTVAEARRMGAMDPGAAPVGATSGEAALAGMTAPSLAPWTAGELGMMFAMWAVMMVAMMTPSATPMLLLHARVYRARDPEAAAPMATLAFAGGYLLAWTGFSALATGLQWALEQAALLAPMMVGTSRWLGAGLLAAAAAYQLSPYKEACLRHCRSPMHFIAEHWRTGTGGAVGMGLTHGLYCIGCCWLLMLLLFVGGVMNLLWVAGLSVLVLLEKVAPRGDLLRSLTAVLLGAGALWLVAGGIGVV